MKNHLIGRTETKGITTMNESETIDPRELNPLALAFSARAQFREEQLLEPLFTEEELAVFKRGRNASKASVAKHASPEEYRASTGFQCLLGWLYLTGQMARVEELFDALWQQFDPNQK